MQNSSKSYGQILIKFQEMSTIVQGTDDLILVVTWIAVWIREFSALVGICDLKVLLFRCIKCFCNVNLKQGSVSFKFHHVLISRALTSKLSINCCVVTDLEELLFL